jgi:hypothetical protein
MQFTARGMPQGKTDNTVVFPLIPGCGPAFRSARAGCSIRRQISAWPVVDYLSRSRISNITMINAVIAAMMILVRLAFSALGLGVRSPCGTRATSD